MPTFKLQLGDDSREYEITRQGSRLHLRHGDTTSELEIIQQANGIVNLLRIHEDGRRQLLRAAGHFDGDNRQLWVNGRTFPATRIRRRSASAAASTGSLAATIPAVVSEILVSVGDTVATGDKLILLESMKMVIPIQAPYNGTVTAINTTPGTAVAAGIPLIEIEPTPQTP